MALVNRMSNRQAVIGDLYFIDQKTLVDAREPPAYLDDIYSMGQVFVRMFYGKYASLVGWWGPYIEGRMLVGYVEGFEGCCHALRMWCSIVYPA